MIVESRFKRLKTESNVYTGFPICTRMEGLC